MHVLNGTAYCSREFCSCSLCLLSSLLSICLVRSAGIVPCPHCDTPMEHRKLVEHFSAPPAAASSYAAIPAEPHRLTQRCPNECRDEHGSAAASLRWQ